MATLSEPQRERREARASLRSAHPGAAHQDWAWVRALNAWPEAAVAVLAAVLLIGIAVVDRAIGGHPAWSTVYLIPVALVGWRSGMARGILWAFMAALAWLAATLSAGMLPLAPAVWGALSRLAVFLVVAATLAALRRERDAVRTLAGTDHLTGIRNARAFRELVELERSRALRYNRPFTLAYMDVDGFQVVNEEWGHTSGDQALRLIATTLREFIRSMDSVSRMGGDEFALLFPETGEGAAEIALQKIQSRLMEAMATRSLALTFTLGGLVCVGAPQSVDDLIQRAENLMYAAKKEGGSGIRTEVLDENFGIEAILQRS